MSRKSRAKPRSPVRCFNSSPEVISMVLLLYVRFPLSLRNVEDLLFERGIDLCHEAARTTPDSVVDSRLSFGGGFEPERF
ncbi:MAG: hypothetical protein BVN32_00275 [Proteobacteria bacterium ST_bin14]|nr:MAG: hypothetical protein BVN32_00275 [Proteobacteria bacterium ST_bin14]